MNKYATANYVCDWCSKKLRTKVINADSKCIRCTRVCRIEPVEEQKPEPELDRIARLAVLRVCNVRVIQQERP